jgi:N-ethylmaleimide reductase
VTKAVSEVWGADRVGIRFSPGGVFNDMHDSNPLATFSYVLKELSALNLAYAHITEVTAQDIAEGWADAVAFGVKFIANPDLPLRFKQDAALNAPDEATFYAPGEKGYTDYPSLAAA